MGWLLRDSRGYTFIEVLTIAGVGALLIVALTALVGRSIHITRDQSQQVQTTEEARRELERTSNTIRSSQDVTVNNQVKNWLESGDNFSITLYSNIDGDPAIEKVRYFVDSADPTTIQKSVIEPDSNGDYTGSEDITPLTRSLRNQAPDQALFYYKDKEGNVLSTPLSSDDLKKVVTVGLAWRIDADPSTDPAPQDIGTEVTPRHNTLIPTATPLPVLLPPTNFDCEALSSTSISCSWTDPNPATVGAPEEDGFKYYDVTTGDVIVDDIAANTTTYVEDNLTPNTEYTRDVTTFNADGETAHSNPDTVTTLPNELNPPTLGPCNATSSTTATCQGSGPAVPPGDPTPTPFIEVYEGPTPTPTVTTGPTPTPISGPTPTPVKTDVPLDINGNFSFSLGGLLPGRSYDIYTKTRKDTKRSDPSNVVTVDTPCTIGSVTGINPSPTPSVTPNPNTSPIPTPRFTSTTAPCFTIGVSVVHVLRVDPDTEAVIDVSAGYNWLIKPPGTNNPAMIYNGGTPGAFAQLEVPQGNPYVIWLRHAPGFPLAGQDECLYLTEPGHPSNAHSTDNDPQPILIGSGNGATNYKLNFYFMPNGNTSYQNPDREFTCRIFEEQGAEVRPQRNLLTVGHFFIRSLQNGAITDSPYYWQYENLFGLSGSGRPGYQQYLSIGTLYSLYLQNYNSPGPYDYNGYMIGCNKLTNGASNSIFIPGTMPAPHYMSSYDFWADNQVVLNRANNLVNCKLIDHFTGAVLKSQNSPQVSVSKVTFNGLDLTNIYAWTLMARNPFIGGPDSYISYNVQNSPAGNSTYILPAPNHSIAGKNRTYLLSLTIPIVPAGYIQNPLSCMVPGRCNAGNYLPSGCNLWVNDINQDKSFNVTITATFVPGGWAPWISPNAWLAPGWSNISCTAT